MRTPITPVQIYPALKALLGLPEHITQFELRVRHDDIVTVACEYYPSFDAHGITEMTTILGEYELVKREPAPRFEFHPEDSLEFQAAKAKVMGFDAWMGERTDRAHAEYMAGHAAGGIDYSKRHARGGFVDGMRLVGEAA